MFPGIGTVVNSIVIILCGLLGLAVGRFLSDRFREIIMQTLGLAVLFIGASGALAKMFAIQEGQIAVQGMLMTSISLVIGGVIGEAISIERLFERFGAWLKQKASQGQDGGFIEGFVTASLIFCVGAMSIIGSIEDALSANPYILFTKAVLDGTITVILTASFGLGVAFSTIPVFLLQGGVTLGALAVGDLMTPDMITAISMVGSMLIFCIGINLFFDKKIRVANMLPAVLIAVIYVMFFPIS